MIVGMEILMTTWTSTGNWWKSMMQLKVVLILFENLTKHQNEGTLLYL